LNFSPWPAIPMLGLEVGAYGLCGLMYGLALGLAGAGLAREQAWLRWTAFALGTLVPVFWLRARFSGIDFEIGSWIVVFSAACLLILLVTPSREAKPVHLRRAGLLFLGSCLVAFPLFVGRALADGDYAVTRHVRAQTIIDALARYEEDEQAYPESLGALVQANYLEELPRPRIGFEIYFDLGWLKPQEFEYRNLGPNYVLEFSSTAWVMCSYNPPWELDEDEEEDLEDWEDAEDLGGAWSCPADRPDLW